MNFIQHKTNNHVLGAPKDWDPSKGVYCAGLPVTLTEQQGQPAVMSFWKPDADELAAINAGHPIVLIVWGNGMPPVSLAVGLEAAP